MASNQTPEYGLNQWSLDDGVIMEEFNTDNRKIEQALLELKASLPKFQAGSFTLTESTTSTHTLTFDFPPQLVILVQAEKQNIILGPTVLLRNVTELFCPMDPASFNELRPVLLHVTWQDNRVSFTLDSEYLPAATYHYMAIG